MKPFIPIQAADAFETGIVPARFTAAAPPLGLAREGERSDPSGESGGPPPAAARVNLNQNNSNADTSHDAAIVRDIARARKAAISADIAHAREEEPRALGEETRRVLRGLMDQVIRSGRWSRAQVVEHLEALGVSKDAYDRAVKVGECVPEEVAATLATISVIGLPPYDGVPA